MKRNILLTSMTCVLSMATTARAEQGGSAHYMPGAMASFIDAFPGSRAGSPC